MDRTTCIKKIIETLDEYEKGYVLVRTSSSINIYTPQSAGELFEKNATNLRIEKVELFDDNKAHTYIRDGVSFFEHHFDDKEDNSYEYDDQDNVVEGVIADQLLNLVDKDKKIFAIQRNYYSYDEIGQFGIVGSRLLGFKNK